MVQKKNIMKEGDQHNKDRYPLVAGRFYAATRDSLNRELDKLLEPGSKSSYEDRLRALISPHAGYIYSGEVAASAFKKINPEINYSNVFILASSHKYKFKGAAVFPYGDYHTPLGLAKVNKEIASELLESDSLFVINNNAHIEEHSLEVQIPFLQRIMEERLQIVPIIIGTDNYKELEKLSQCLEAYFSPENLFIISSDFSHYPTYNDAIDIDKNTLDRFFEDSAAGFSEWISGRESQTKSNVLTRMCGWSSALILKFISDKRPGLEYKHIMYANSGDIKDGDKQSVVGYHSVALIDISDDSPEFILSEKDKEVLLDIARKNIESRLKTGTFYKPDPDTLSDNLSAEAGAFVTLRKGKELRGCIGRINASEALFETVRQMSAAAAFNDSRFEPLALSEYEKISIEISVLSPLRKVESVEEIIVGKHGVMLKFTDRTATFLPQVALEQGWDRDEFLGRLSRDKAGMGWSGWKNADIYIYEAIIVDERKHRQ